MNATFESIIQWIWNPGQPVNQWHCTPALVSFVLALFLSIFTLTVLKLCLFAQLKAFFSLSSSLQSSSEAPDSMSCFQSKKKIMFLELKWNFLLWASYFLLLVPLLPPFLCLFSTSSSSTESNILPSDLRWILDIISDLDKPQDIRLTSGCAENAQ